MSTQQQFPPIMTPLSNEEKAELRRKSLATLKASTQLLKEAEEWANGNSKMSDTEKSDYSRHVHKAIIENEMKAQYAGVSKEELEKIEYSKPSQNSIDRYNAYLKKVGKTHEEVARKDIATSVSYAEKAKKESTRKRRRSRLNGLVDAEIVRLPNEDELMNQTRIKDDVSTEDAVKEFLEKRDKKQNETQKQSEVKKPSEEEKVTESSNNKNKLTVNIPQTAEDYIPFDASEVEMGVVFDKVPLPSKGQCYRHKLTHLEVAELTAEDENIIAAPQMYRDGTILDTILERKILNKNIKPSELCKGDRDAILLWLRLTAYGPDYPIYATNPETGKRYNIVTRLDQFDFRPFSLTGDEQGWFNYTTGEGDNIKFCYITNRDEENLRNTLLKDVIDVDTMLFMKDINNIRNTLKTTTSLEGEAKMEIKDCLDDIVDILSENNMSTPAENDSRIVLKTITEQMILYTKSVNGNTDQNYIRHYIEHMRAGEARKYRQYVSDNRPGVDFGLTVNIPESDGGGSFDTFLRLEDSIFINF